VSAILVLDDITVSRNHARLTRREGHVWVEDENSLNGTYVNKALIDGPVALRREPYPTGPDRPAVRIARQDNDPKRTARLCRD